MKHLRLFEELEYKYKVGDYILIDYNTKSSSKLKKFVKNSIGKIVFIGDGSIIVHYDNIPDDIKHYFSEKIVGNKKFKNSAFFLNSYIKIIRLATEDEIYENEIQKNSKKFNI